MGLRRLEGRLCLGLAFDREGARVVVAGRGHFPGFSCFRGCRSTYCDTAVEEDVASRGAAISVNTGALTIF